MRLYLLPQLLLFTSLASLSTSHLILPNHKQQALRQTPPTSTGIQTPIIMPVLPPSDSSQDTPSSPKSQSPMLYDTLPLIRRINIFSSLLRDHPDMSDLLSQSPRSTSQSTTQDQPPHVNMTILAPLNSAMQSLSHKPWESPQEYEDLGERAYDGEGGQERANANLRKFVEGHVVPRGAEEWSEGVKVETLMGKGREVWWEEREAEGKGEGKRKVIMPDEVEVEGIESKAANGEVWLLKGVLKV